MPAVVVTMDRLARLTPCEVQRMELAHEKSVAALQHNMTMRSAFAYLQENPKVTPELPSLFRNLPCSTRQLTEADFFRIHAEDRPTGYGGLD